MTAVDLCNNDVIAHLNKTSLIQRDDISLLSQAQDHDFGKAVYDAAHHYCRNQYIHSGHHIILMKF